MIYTNIPGFESIIPTCCNHHEEKHAIDEHWGWDCSQWIVQRIGIVRESLLPIVLPGRSPKIASPSTSTTIKPSSKTTRLNNQTTSEYHNIDSKIASLLKEIAGTAQLPEPPGIEPTEVGLAEARHPVPGDDNRSSRRMPVQKPEVLGEAKEEEFSNAVSRASGGQVDTIAVPEPDVYARQRSLACATTSSVGIQDDAKVAPSIVVEQSTGHGKGQRGVHFSAPCEPTGVGKAPQQKCVAWRSSVVACNGVSLPVLHEVLPADQA